MLGTNPKIERGLNVVVCRLRDDDPKLLFARKGSNGVGACAIETGELFSATSRPPSL